MSMSLYSKESIEIAVVKLCFPIRNSYSYTSKLNIMKSFYTYE